MLTFDVVSLGRSLGAVAVAVVALACGSARGPDDAGVAADVEAPLDAAPLDAVVRTERWAPEEDAERLAQAECAWARRCAPSLSPRWGWDDEACVLAARAVRSEVLVRRAQLVSDGRARFLRAPFEACLATYAAPGCAPVVCAPYFEGLAALGEACGHSDACAGADTYCTGEATSSCGLCARRASGFAACALDVECLSDRCEQRCLPPVGEGDQCEKGCRFGLCCPGSCVGFGLGSGVCRRAAGLGEPCDPAEAAAPRCATELGLACVARRCAPVAVVLLGEACDEARWCADGASCLGGVCQPWPRVGEPCDGTCVGDAVCAHGRCRVPPAEGEPCVLDRDCAPSLVCRGSAARVCRAPHTSSCE